MITYVLPTCNRPAVLERTLRDLARLPGHNAEVLVIDNGSEHPQRPTTLANGVRVRVHCLDHNESAAARNHAIPLADPRSAWFVMLDDDSCPLDLGLLGVLEQSPATVGAIGAEVLLPSIDGGLRHESGGLPEVFVGCGAAIRANVFRELGGYDPQFDYYAEEYDFCARLIARGLQVGFDRRFRVLHRKEATGRDFSRIVANLVRNNCWVAARYAPDDETKRHEVARHLARYAAIACKECAFAGYARGCLDLLRTFHTQPARAMSPQAWARLTGFTHACEAIHAEMLREPLGPTRMVALGKHAHIVEAAALACGVRLVDAHEPADTLLIATLSPGPMLDAAAQHGTSVPDARIVMPWLPGSPASQHSLHRTGLVRLMPRAA